MDPLPVLVVSADPLARSGLAALVAGIPELSLAGEVGPLQATRVEASRSPRVILWDVGGAVRGDEGAPWSELSAPVVALAADAEQAAGALRAGARAVVSRTAAPEELVAAITGAARGLLVLDPGLAGPFLRAPEPRGG